MAQHPPTHAEQLEAAARLVQQRLGAQFHWMTLLSMETENLIIELTAPRRLTSSAGAVDRLERDVVAVVRSVMPDAVTTVLVHS
jgi:hypothetical protein